MGKQILEIEDLNIFFKSDRFKTPTHALRDVSFTLSQGEMLGVVGESGSGKSITNLAIMGLLGENASVSASKCLFNNHSLLNLTDKEWQKIRGRDVAMIFQDPMTALNPLLSVEFQLIETILTHTNCDKKEAKEKALDLLNLVGITSPKERIKSYPFELSGGMAQRIMIAMAISSDPKLLIADEPTTALDVTIQKQILLLIKKLQLERNLSIILVTHDLGLVSEFSDRVQVMYAGEIVENGPTSKVITQPKHPYTAALMNSRPNPITHKPKSQLPTITGIVPLFHERPSGCQFNPRCLFAKNDCLHQNINLVEGVRCQYPLGGQND